MQYLSKIEEMNVIVLSETQEIFRNVDPMGFISMGKDDDIYNRISESLQRHLINLKLFPTIYNLAYTILALLKASFSNLNPSFEYCVEISRQLIQKCLRKASK